MKPAGCLIFTATLMLAGSFPAKADPRLTPLAPDVPIAHPVAKVDLPPPPFALIADRPVNPAYVPGLPGLKQGGRSRTILASTARPNSTAC